MSVNALPDRYQSMQYRRSGHSGLDFPLVSLGFWHNFGGIPEDSRAASGSPFLKAEHISEAVMEKIRENAAAVRTLELSADEISEIEKILHD